MLLFCKSVPRKTHLTAEIQVAVGCEVFKDVTYCKNSPHEGEWRIASCGGGCNMESKIFDSSLYLGRKPLLCRSCEFYSIQGLDHWKPKSLREERKGEKIYARFFEESPRLLRPEICRVQWVIKRLLAVCISPISPSFLINWIYLRPKGG